jgi:hypothetical protein
VAVVKVHRVYRTVYRMLKNTVDSVHHPIFEYPLGEFTGENMYYIWRMLCIQRDIYFLVAGAMYADDSQNLCYYLQVCGVLAAGRCSNRIFILSTPLRFC